MATKRKPTTTPGALSRAQRDSRILAMRLEQLKKGEKSLRAIADAEGLSVGRVHSILARTHKDSLESNHEMGLESLAFQVDLLEGTLLPLAVKDATGAERSPAHMASVVKLLDHHAKLTGALSATKTEISGPNGGPVKVERTLDLSGLTEDQLAVAREIAALNEADEGADD